MRAGQVELINPLIECETAQDINNSELLTDQKEIHTIVDDAKNAGKIDDSAIYFRDLNDGPWFGIDEKTKFYQASLVKIPLMLAYLKKSQSDPEIMQRTLTYKPSIGEHNDSQPFTPEKAIQMGNSYKIAELIEMMIRYSDNNAYALLSKQLSETEFTQIFTDFGLIAPPLYTSSAVYSARDYARFFRILYNASYLNQENSNKALKLLTQTTFIEGLVAGIPKEITVAHKYGAYENGAIKQLHDCGIIYYPKNPYILCIMTKGSNFSELKTIISDISRVVYENVNKQLKSQ